MKRIKTENLILIMLAFFSISMGLWENFRQLWLQDNNFAVTNIRNIISIGTLISVIAIFFIGKSIKVEKLKNFIILSLTIKFINAIFLFCLNNTQNNILINFLIIIDLLTGYLITTSIYTLITTIIKNNTIYSKRKLTEYLFKDIGIFVGGLLIGRSIIGVFVNYNVCLLISAIFLIFSTIIMISIPADKTDEQNSAPKISIIKYIGEAIGVFLCGLMYEKGLRYMFGLSAFFMIFQIGLAYYLIYLRGKKNSEKIYNN